MEGMKDRIRLARVERGLSQEQLANRVGVETASVSRWETGAALPRPTKMLKIAEALGKPTSYFTTPHVDQELSARLAVLEEIVKQNTKPVAPAVSVRAVVSQIDALVLEEKLKPFQAHIAQYFLSGDKACLKGLSEQLTLQIQELRKSL